MSETVEKRSQLTYVTEGSEEDEIERLLLELERLSAAVERRAAEAAREAAEQGCEIDRLLTLLRADLARHDAWFRMSSAT